MSGAVNSILEVKSGRTEYILSPVFEPVWNQTGKIFAFEMLSDIRSAKDGRKICASVFFRSAPPDIQYKILISQLKTAETLHKWCLQKKIMLSVNISGGSPVSENMASRGGREHISGLRSVRTFRQWR